MTKLTAFALSMCAVLLLTGCYVRLPYPCPGPCDRFPEPPPPCRDCPEDDCCDRPSAACTDCASF